MGEDSKYNEMTMAQLYQAFREEGEIYLHALRRTAKSNEIKKIGAAMDEILCVIRKRFELRESQFLSAIRRAKMENSAATDHPIPFLFDPYKR